MDTWKATGLDLLDQVCSSVFNVLGCYHILPQISNGSLDYFYPTEYEARYVRFTVKTWYRRACMRVGILNGKLDARYASSKITLSIGDHEVYF